MAGSAENASEWCLLDLSRVGPDSVNVKPLAEKASKKVTKKQSQHTRASRLVPQSKNKNKTPSSDEPSGAAENQGFEIGVSSNSISFFYDCPENKYVQQRLNQRLAVAPSAAVVNDGGVIGCDGEVSEFDVRPPVMHFGHT